VITVRGEIDASTAPQLRDRLEEVAPAARRRVVLDVKDVDFRDWTGLGVLVGGRKRLRQAGGDLVLRSPKPATTKLLEISGLQGIFTIE
jgi:anti-sigma B factor antagonist